MLAGSRARFLLLAFVAGSSGFYALLYQVLWDRVLRFNFGGDSVASAIVTSSFLLGLGLGALAFGRTFRRPLRVLGLVEIGIGVFALLSYSYLGRLAAILVSLSGGGLDDLGGIRTGVLVGSVLFIVPPALLMGGTLPLFFGSFVGRGAYRAGAVGLVYGLNTVGAAAGVLAAPFLLLNHFDIPTCLAVAGGAQILFGCWLVFVIREAEAVDGAAAEAPSTPSSAGLDESGLRLPSLMVLSAVSGSVILGFEISLFRHFYTVNPSSPYNFTLVLMPYLLGLALGSTFFSRTAAGAGGVRVRVGALFLIAQLGLLLAIWLGSDTVLLGEMGRLAALRHWLGLTFLFPLLSGAVFPLLLRLAASSGDQLPRRTGFLYLANSLGAFTGGLTVQFIGLPMAGTKAVLLTLFYAGVAAGAFSLSRPAVVAGRRALLAGVVVAVAGAPLLVPARSWRDYTFVRVERGVIHEEGVSGVASLAFNDDRSLAEVLVNGQHMSDLPDAPKHVRLTAFALSQPQRQHVLLLGLGGGGMVRELRLDPAVDRVDAVDWSHELPAVLARRPARRLLEDALSADDVRLFTADARVALEIADQDSYQLIIDNLAFGHWVGATTVKSQQYYEEVARVLAPGGLFIYDTNFSSELQRAQSLAAIRSTWPHVRLHSTISVLLASDQPIRLDSSYVDGFLRPRYEALGIEGPPESRFLLERLVEVTAEEVAGISPTRDEWLVHEFTRHPLCGWLGHPPALP